MVKSLVHCYALPHAMAARGMTCILMWCVVIGHYCPRSCVRVHKIRKIRQAVHSRCKNYIARPPSGGTVTRNLRKPGSSVRCPYSQARALPSQAKPPDTRPDYQV
ncbi:hypothetical protein F4821DRAFT_248847 [Hypoxylon rubiginosum]|uniref:Uncharacterized protein n=1 Tax=Hypoxylon rubiginosum TaxID=110542 RepID=A0ACC0CMM7_9PEZI|nr:hypothetical protein F4821DRAFT_248847 [Hypoxylon rubiginosum]